MRGINFLDQWLADNIRETVTADVISVDELSEASAVGIKRIEMDEEVTSLYRTILDAIVHHDPGLPE